MKISVVVPVYGCPEALHPLHERLVNTLAKITEDYEIILVNDSCPKGSWNIVQEICAVDEKVVGINLSRNFGQKNATNAGIEYSTGDYVVLMDCDLQDKPEAIEELYCKLQEGYDIVYVARQERKDNFFVKFCSKMFYKVYNYMVEGHFDSDIANYSMVRRQVVDEYCKLPEHNKDFVTILSWMGYRSAIIHVESDKRMEGKSSYNMRRKINLAIDMITFQSNKPLQFFIKLGMAIGFLALCYLVYQVGMYFVDGTAPMGWTSTIAIVSLIGGLQLVSLGVIGIYIGNIFNETKNRKSYFIQEILNENSKKHI